MPFLRLTRDRRGHEHTFLLHAGGPGQKPRVIYWYRTAPDILMGRPPLDEEAIRTIEDQHPGIEFDWPALLALREAMSHEEESRPERPRRPKPPARGGDDSRPAPAPAAPIELAAEPPPVVVNGEADGEEDAAADIARGLLEDLVGRDIARRLRARHGEIVARIGAYPDTDPRVAAWRRRASALDPDSWLTPDAALQGVQQADGLYEALKRELQGPDA